LVTFELTTYDEKDKNRKSPLFVNTFALFIRGLGGFGFKGLPSESLPTIPTKPADKILT